MILFFNLKEITEKIFKGVLGVIKIQKKLEDEQEQNRVLINSVMPHKLTEKVMKDLTSEDHRITTMRPVNF